MRKCLLLGTREETNMLCRVVDLTATCEQGDLVRVAALQCDSSDIIFDLPQIVETFFLYECVNDDTLFASFLNSVSG